MTLDRCFDHPNKEAMSGGSWRIPEYSKCGCSVTSTRCTAPYDFCQTKCLEKKLQYVPAGTFMIHYT